MSKDRRGEPGITLDSAVSELIVLVDDAIDFIDEFEDEWDLAERYYNGETDLETVPNRSNVVKTEVRDAIRNTLPSVMRVLFHSRKIVDYIPSSVEHAPWVEQQALYARQLFDKCGGYLQLYSSIMEAFKLKIGPQKVSWVPEPKRQYIKYTAAPFSLIENLIGDDDFELERYEVCDPKLQLYDVEGYKSYHNGQIRYEAVPNYEFFITRGCNSIEDAISRGTHGHQAVVTVAEAEELGLNYDNWLTLDYDDPETDTHTASSTSRRGYDKDETQETSVDVSKHEFLLIEAYVSYDLKGDGKQRLYKFYLGGTSKEYLHHEEVEDSPFALIIPNPVPHSVHGHSIADYTIKEQDTGTSLLRAAVDNAHAANNAKIAADPRLTNFDDLMNPALNAPVRKKAGDTLQVIQTPFTGQGMLGLLNYLDLDVQSKVGVTKAAQGLDPDAMQSTDKNAVMNTIQTSQGQVELMVRNIIETGLIRVFRLMMKLSIRHADPTQLVNVKGKYIPVNTRLFDPDAQAIPAVGLGRGSPEQKAAALQFIYQQQQAYLEKYGPNNPFTSFAQLYNTLEDLMESQGVYNTERYFNIVTPAVEQEWARAQEKQHQQMMQMQQQNQPMDPSKAYLQIEAEKAQIEKAKLAAQHSKDSANLAQQAYKDAEQLDIQRDKLIQDRVIKLAEIEQDSMNTKIQAEQRANDARESSTGTAKKGGEKSS